MLDDDTYLPDDAISLVTRRARLRRMRLSLGLVLLAAAARADAPRTDAEVARCLATRDGAGADGACDAAAPCPASSAYTRAR